MSEILEKEQLETELTEKSEVQEPQKIEDVFGKISGQALAEKPKVSEHVIEQQEEEILPSENTSENGEVFNPEIHAVDNDGNPRKTKTGKFAKKRGRKKVVEGDTTSTQGKSQLGSINTDDKVNQISGSTPEEEERAQSILISKLGSQSLGHIRQIISDLPTSQEELIFLENIIMEWANETGAAMNPNVALVAATSVFMMPAIQTKKTQGIFKRFTNKILVLFRLRKPTEEDQKEKGE